MNIEFEDKHGIQWRTPPNYGWLNYTLKQKELDYIWKCVNNKKHDLRKTLAGNISSSFALIDEDEWLFKNILYKLIYAYQDQFGKQAYPLDVLEKKMYSHMIYCLDDWWVNYQKQHEFNPLHNHRGVYSFVIWLKIPTDYEDQNKNNITNSRDKSSFSFVYTNILGQIKSERIPLSKEYEGRMVFFPSSLMHLVQPFYDCEDDRISVSGNICMKIMQ